METSLAKNLYTILGRIPLLSCNLRLTFVGQWSGISCLISSPFVTADELPQFFLGIISLKDAIHCHIVTELVASQQRDSCPFQRLFIYFFKALLRVIYRFFAISVWISFCPSVSLFCSNSQGFT